jgi:protocatechuate 3,4-dioxygenase beta subunit
LEFFPTVLDQQDETALGHAMKRRTLILGGLALAGGAAGATMLWPRRHAAIAAASFDWKGSDFLSGGTRGLPAGSLPLPVFRERPNCTVTMAQTLGPCHVNGVPVRADVTEGQPGLPMRVAFRLVRASDCSPIEGADVEIWHTDRRGIYTGREAAAMCTLDDAEAMQGLAFRGRQVTAADGVATFMTIYPGWYSGRTIHIHCRIVVDGRELLVSQVYFDDNLSDIIFGQHPEYEGRPERDTKNADDGIFPATDPENYIFDFEKLEAGVLSASITIGVEV